jgi:sugar phosphate permease
MIFKSSRDFNHDSAARTSDIRLEDLDFAGMALDDRGVRPTRARYQVLAAACSLAVVTYIHRVGFATASAEFKKPLGLTDQHLGTMMAAFMIGYGVFEIPWGFLGDRLGVRNILAAIILGGSAQGTIWMSSRLGGAMAPLLLVGLFRAMGDWKMPLVLMAVVGLAWCAWFWPWFRNRPEEMARVNPAERTLIEAGRAGHWGAGHGQVPWARMLRSRSVWSLCLMYAFLGFSGNFYLTLLPTYLKNHRGLSSEVTGWLTSLPFAFGVVACVVGGSFSDVIIRHWGKRWGRRIVGAAGMTVAGLAILAVPRVDHVAALGFLLTLAFFGNDLAMAPAWAAAADMGDRYTGTLAGTMNMMASFMAAIQAIAIGRLLEAHNLVLPFELLAISYALGTLAWVGVDVRQTLADRS